MLPPCDCGRLQAVAKTLPLREPPAAFWKAHSTNFRGATSLDGQSLPCLVLVDLQYAFFDESVPMIGHLEKALCLPGVSRLLSHARKSSWNVIHVISVHDHASDLPSHLQRIGLPLLCQRDTPGSRMVAGFFRSGDTVVEKKGYSAFGGTALREYCRSDTIIIGGVAADCCILHTSFDAATAHRKEVWLPYQAVGASTREAYDRGLACIAKSAGAVVDLEEILAGRGLLWESRVTPERVASTAGKWHDTQIGRLADFRATGGDSRANPVEERLRALLQHMNT